MAEQNTVCSSKRCEKVLLILDMLSFKEKNQLQSLSNECIPPFHCMVVWCWFCRMLYEYVEKGKSSQQDPISVIYLVSGFKDGQDGGLQVIFCASN